MRKYLRTICSSIFIFLLLLMGVAVAQRAQLSAPATPLEAYERAREPELELQKNQRVTLEQDTKAREESARRAAVYASLFKIADWEGEQLYGLAQLYFLAKQFANAEKAYSKYLREPRMDKATLARTYLLMTLINQEKPREAVPTAERLLEEPVYDQSIIGVTKTLIDSLRQIDERQAAALAEKMVPGIFKYAEEKAAVPGLANHVATVLQHALAPAVIYRESGDVAKSEEFITSFLSKFNESPLSSTENIKKAVESSIFRTRLIGGTAPRLEATEFIDFPKTIIADTRGKVVLLDFLAHWCAPCVTKFPQMDRLQQKYGERGLMIVGVTSPYGFFGERQDMPAAEELAALKKLKADKKAKYGFIVGPRSNEFAYGVTGLPAMVLIDRSGKVRFIAGGSDRDVAEMEKRVEMLLKEPSARRGD